MLFSYPNIKKSTYIHLSDKINIETSEEWQQERLLCALSLKFQQLEQVKFSKIGTLKLSGRPVGTNRGGKKEEEPRQARDIALQPRTHCQAQSERGEIRL